MGQLGKQFFHRRVALELLPSQFSESANLRAMVEALVGDATLVQELENVAWDLYTKRWLWIAEGAQLDRLGEVLEEPRSAGLSDDDYRARLQVAVRVYNSNGEPDRLIEIAQFAAAPTEIQLIEKSPPTAYLFAHVITALDSLYFITRAVAGGVFLVFVANFGTTPFTFGPDKDAAGTDFGSGPGYGAGWGETGAGNEGIGGQFSELFIGG